MNMNTESKDSGSNSVKDEVVVVKNAQSAVSETSSVETSSAPVVKPVKLRKDGSVDLRTQPRIKTADAPFGKTKAGEPRRAPGKKKKS